MATDTATTTGSDDVSTSKQNGDMADLGPVDFQTARLGLPQKYWRYRRSYKTRRKVASKGYVEWYLIDNTHPRPKYIKPEGKGGGIREYEYEDSVYLFPEEAMLPDEETGIQTIYHKRNESLPIPINQPLRPSMKGDELKDYLTKRVTTSPPGLLDSLPFDVNAQTLIGAAIALIIIWALLSSVLGGM